MPDEVQYVHHHDLSPRCIQHHSPYVHPTLGKEWQIMIRGKLAELALSSIGRPVFRQASWFEWRRSYYVRTNKFISLHNSVLYFAQSTDSDKEKS